MGEGESARPAGLRGNWWRVLLGGLLLFGVSLGVLILTQNLRWKEGVRRQAEARSEPQT